MTVRRRRESRRSESKGPWYLFSGVLIGLVLGLLYTWVIQPVQFVDTSPDLLRSEFKDQYRSLIALAYQSNDDVGRARSRLLLLDGDDMDAALAEQAGRVAQAGGSPAEAEALASLASAISGQPAAATTPTVQSEPAGSAANSTSTPAAPDAGEESGSDDGTAADGSGEEVHREGDFVLKTQSELCNTPDQAGLLQIDVIDAGGEPASGVPFVIRWGDETDTVITGRLPAVSSGYAEYQMTEGVEYSLSLAGQDAALDGLAVPDCDGEPGVIRLLFVEE
jgi:hypothetical protein